MEKLRPDMRVLKKGKDISLSIKLGTAFIGDGKPHFSEAALYEILEYQINAQFPHAREIIYQKRGETHIISDEVLTHISKLPLEEQAFFINEQLSNLKRTERLVI